MGMYFAPYRNLLDKYLDRYNESSERKIRNLTDMDIQTVGELEQLFRDMNTTITELLLVKEMVRHVDNENMEYICNNFQRIVMSLRKQKSKGWLIRYAVMAMKPTDEEQELIDKFIRDSRNRIKYIEGFVLYENVKLTPLYDYLEIIREKDIRKLINDRFKTRKEMVELSNGEKLEELESFIQDILEEVSAHGREKDYEARLNKYVEIAREKKEMRDREKKEEEVRRKLILARDAMSGFHRMFNKGVITMDGDSRIKMGGETVRSMINTYGRNTWFILCCYAYGKGIVYRYGGEKDLVVWFKSAKPYFSEADAEEEAESLRKLYPRRLFDTVQLSCIESA